VSHIRLFSGNLLHGRADAEALAAQLAELAVDVACFQELGERQAVAIERVLPHGKLEPAPGPRCDLGMGIAARRPLATGRLPLPQRDARTARLEPADWPGLRSRLDVVNLHLQAPHVLPPWRTLATRAAQLRALTAHLDATPGARRVLAGDLNATPLWPLYRALSMRVVDVVAEHALRRGEAAQRTWGPWPGAPRLLRIDHALASGVFAADVRVLPVRGSDHSALLVDLIEEAGDTGHVPTPR
jgi:endonuclease/exonuclease/phosphatase (EEP) superfamily protein YafD